MRLRVSNLLKIKNKSSIINLCIAVLFITPFLFSVNKLLNRIEIRKTRLSKCDPVQNIAFLKMHKAASSAVQNIFFRYGHKRNLKFAIPNDGNYFGTAQTFKASMIPTGQKPNIFAVHTKWDQSQIKMVMPNDTKYVTIIREPTQLFESLYVFANFEKKLRMSIDDYARKTSLKSKRVGGYLGFNQMAYDLGMPTEMFTNLTPEDLHNFIQDVDANFDLVLMADKMDESMVLLKNFLCCDLQEVVTFQLNSRLNKYKQELSQKTKEILKKKLYIDYEIYNYFKKKFEQKVNTFGIHRMKDEIQKLHVLREQMKNDCGFEETDPENLFGSFKPWSNMVKGLKSKPKKSGIKSTCRFISWNEHAALDYLRKKQIEKRNTTNVIKHFVKR